ncbi:MAG TPA: DNA topoisomerase IV subunit A, partial [Kofleriaceae bacterium]|nr:DNA topoisomerase IV subunit A [Kofleriaceae bacterium]
MAKKATVAPKEGRKAKSKAGGGGDDAGGPPSNIYGGDGGGGDDDTALAAEARRRYLNYALSVITSRALPDVRDGLKPVQRRILYAMLHEEHLRPDAKHRKSAKVVGTVLGKYHPHGDSSVYDAMVRMAQDFTLRLPLVDGSGNFGSLDGDEAAAYRYTECRLAPPAMDLLRELDQKTVPMRSNYDGTTVEPQVLPARFPNLLVNGSTGIAVGMATNIPPHNLGEVIDAAVALIADKDLTTTNLMKFVQGPDFPTGGQILNSKPELREIYDAGQGAIRVRGEYKLEEKKRGGTDIVITSIPWAMTKASLVEKIAEVILSRKLPFLLDVRDESTTDVRIVLEIKKEADPTVVMAYLYKHTPLQQNFNLNITALVPVNGDDEEEVPEELEQGESADEANPEPPAQPQRMGLKDVLQHFLDFRMRVTRRRFRHELRQLERRIHILEGLAKIFDALDETIKIIRASDGKADAAQKLMKRFGLDEIQVDAILELKLYKLAKLEIKIIREELDEKEAQAKKIRLILKSEAKLWDVVKGDLEEIKTAHNTKRKTKTGGSAEEIEVSEDAFIVDEDANVVVTRDGWIKRVRELKDPTSTRTREGDEVMAVLPGSTKEKVIFMTNRGSGYVVKINDIAATTGYGDPAQKYFKFGDGERIVASMSLDPRLSVPEQMLAVSRDGHGLRFATAGHVEVTTKAGRRFAKPSEGDEIIGVVGVKDTDFVIAATHKGHVLQCKAEEISKLEGPGRGVTLIKIGRSAAGGKTAEDDHVIGFTAGEKGTVLPLENA